MTDGQIIDGILAHEGGWVDHPLDKGGPTNYGITLATLSRWRGRDMTAEDVKDLSIEEARDIYRALYLEPFDGVDQAVKAQVVDIAVNSGVGRARALLAVAEQKPERPLSVQLVVERIAYYEGIVQRNPSQRVFLLGWLRRAISFLALVLVLGGCAMREPPLIIWHRRAPEGWTAPAKYAACTIRGEKVLEDGTPNGHQTIRLDCPESIVFLDKRTKRLVWEGDAW